MFAVVSASQEKMGEEMLPSVILVRDTRFVHFIILIDDDDDDNNGARNESIPPRRFTSCLENKYARSRYHGRRNPFSAKRCKSRR